MLKFVRRTAARCPSSLKSDIAFFFFITAAFFFFFSEPVTFIHYNSEQISLFLAVTSIYVQFWSPTMLVNFPVVGLIKECFISAFPFNTCAN